MDYVPEIFAFIGGKIEPKQKDNPNARGGLLDRDPQLNEKRIKTTIEVIQDPNNAEYPATFYLYAWQRYKQLDDFYKKYRASPPAHPEIPDDKEVKQLLDLNPTHIIIPPSKISRYDNEAWDEYTFTLERLSFALQSARLQLQYAMLLWKSRSGSDKTKIPPLPESFFDPIVKESKGIPKLLPPFNKDDKGKEKETTLEEEKKPKKKKKSSGYDEEEDENYAAETSTTKPNEEEEDDELVQTELDITKTKQTLELEKSNEMNIMAEIKILQSKKETAITAKKVLEERRVELETKSTKKPSSSSSSVIKTTSGRKRGRDDPSPPPTRSKIQKTDNFKMTNEDEMDTLEQLENAIEKQRDDIVSIDNTIDTRKEDLTKVNRQMTRHTAYLRELKLRQEGLQAESKEQKRRNTSARKFLKDANILQAGEDAVHGRVLKTVHTRLAKDDAKQKTQTLYDSEGKEIENVTETEKKDIKQKEKNSRKTQSNSQLNPLFKHDTIDDFRSKEFTSEDPEPLKCLISALQSILQLEGQALLQQNLTRNYFEATTRSLDNSEVMDIDEETYKQKENETTDEFYARSYLNNSRCVTIQGEPGTGKTTVALIYQQIMYGLGVDAFLDSGEAGRASDFIGRFEGETQLKAKKEMATCIGTTRFYDEFYVLVEKKGDSNSSAYGFEALTVITQEISQQWGLRTIIIAGYADKMKSLLDVNDGLRRRMGGGIWTLKSVDRKLLEKRFLTTFTTLKLTHWFPNLMQDVFEKHLAFIFEELYKPSPSNGNKHWLQNYNYSASDIFKTKLLRNMQYYNKLYVKDVHLLEELRKAYLKTRKAAYTQSNAMDTDESETLFNFAYPPFLLKRPSSKGDTLTDEERIYLDKRHVYMISWDEFVEQITNNTLEIGWTDDDFVGTAETSRDNEAASKASQNKFAGKSNDLPDDD